MAYRDILWDVIPPTRLGEFSGRIKCPCETQFWDVMDEFFPKGASKVLVDVGCGPGIKALTFALNGFRVVGFDIREREIGHARENARQTRAAHPDLRLDAEFFQHNLQHGLPQMTDSSVDVAVFVEVIEHLDAYRSVLREIQRVLKPGGSVIITTPNKHLHQHEKGADEAVYGEKAFGHVREFDLNELAEEVEQAGLHVAHRGYLNPPKVKAYCALIHPWMIRDHGFLQGRAGIQDVIGIRTLGKLQPLYNLCFSLITAIIGAYNSLIFPRLYRATKPALDLPTGRTLLVIGTKP